MIVEVKKREDPLNASDHLSDETFVFKNINSRKSLVTSIETTR